MQSVEELDEEVWASLSFRIDSPERIAAAIDSAAAAGEDGDDFDFSFLSISESIPPTSADDIFSDGKIRPIYPVFNRDLLDIGEDDSESESKPTIRLPLRHLFMEEEKDQSSSSFSSTSSSSSLVDELDGIPEATYCVWTPSAKKDACKKSKSTGSGSRRWRLRDLVVGRSHSDGKEKFVVIPIQNKEKEKEKGKAAAAAEVDPAAAQRRRTRVMLMRKQGSGQIGQGIGKATGSAGKKSFDLVGFLTNANANGFRSQNPFH